MAMDLWHLIGEYGVQIYEIGGESHGHYDLHLFELLVSFVSFKTKKMYGALKFCSTFLQDLVSFFSFDS